MKKLQFHHYDPRSRLLTRSSYWAHVLNAVCISKALLTHVVEPDCDLVVDRVQRGDDDGEEDLGAEAEEVVVTIHLDHDVQPLLYKVVHQDSTPEIEVFCMMFERCNTERGVRSFARF